VDVEHPSAPIMFFLIPKAISSSSGTMNYEMNSVTWPPELFSHQGNFIVDIRVTDTDAVSYKLNEPSKVVLEAAECLKKKKYLQLWIDQHYHFTPFVVLVDGVIGKEVKMVL
jgi:hypothetical protein